MKNSPPKIFGLHIGIAVVLLVRSANAQLNEQVLHSFAGSIDGQQPYAPLVQGADGALYGTTYMGGSNNAGTVFRVNPNGSGNQPVFSFGSNGVDPFGLAYPSGLLQGYDGKLYGTTGFGGSFGHGSVFRLNSDGTGYTVLHSFDTSAGYEPTAALAQSKDGFLYGTTQQGGNAGLGTVFRISSDGNGFSQIYSFGSFQGDSQTPQAPLIVGADGALYGTTSAGGASAVGGASGYGTVFRLNTNGTGQAVLHSFLPTGGDGQVPYAGLVQATDGTLYGTTQQGGKLADNQNSGYGTIFKINPDGSGFAIVHSFDGSATDGKYPNSALVRGNDGALYGTTEWGGSNNLGAVFKLNIQNNGYALLHSFGSTDGDGSYPKASLVRASDGGLFGTAQFGGDNNFGVVFRLGPAPAVLSAVKSLPDKTVQITISSAPQFAYRIEASTDRVHWETVTNLVNTNGTMQFIDPQAPSFAHRFYRAAWIP